MHHVIGKDMKKEKRRASDATDTLRGKNIQAVESTNTRHCLSNFQMSL